MRANISFIVFMVICNGALANDLAGILDGIALECRKPNAWMESVARVITQSKRNQDSQCDLVKVKGNVYNFLDQAYGRDVAQTDESFRLMVDSANSLLGKIDLPKVSGFVGDTQGIQIRYRGVTETKRRSRNFGVYTELKGSN